MKKDRKIKYIIVGTDFAVIYRMKGRNENKKANGKVGFMDIYYGVLDFMVNRNSPNIIAKKLKLTLKEFYLLRDKFLDGAKEGIKNALRLKKQNAYINEEEKRRFPRISLEKEKVIASLNNKENTTLCGKVTEVGIKNLSVKLKSGSTIPANKIMKLLLKENGNFKEAMAQVTRTRSVKDCEIAYMEVI